MATKNIIAFVPVLHEGYRRFLEKHGSASVLYLLGAELINEFPHLLKEIRMLSPELTKASLETWGVVQEVRIAQKEDLAVLAKTEEVVVMPDEDVMRELKEKYFPEKEVLFDAVFLRWDKHNTVAEKPVSPDQKVSSAAFDKEMMQLASEEAKKSSDWWRRMGAIIIKDGAVIISAHNNHVPSEHLPYQNGDPRNNFHKGVHLELSTVLHAESGAIAEAARKGIALEGTSMYTGTFPCPPCAKLIAYSGIKKIYYHTGYGVLDGESILKSQGVEIIFVEE